MAAEAEKVEKARQRAERDYEDLGQEMRLMRKASIPKVDDLESIKNVVSGRQLEIFLAKYVRKQIIKHDYSDMLARQPDQTQLKAIVKVLSRGTEHIDNVVYNFEHQ